MHSASECGSGLLHQTRFLSTSLESEHERDIVNAPGHRIMWWQLVYSGFEDEHS